jgi:putative PIN family toxin of toxin-antitoxin system
MRAVIDTNLFVSGMFATSGLSKRLMDCWVAQEFQLVISREIIWEVWRVVHYPRIQETFHPREEEIRRFIAMIFRKAVITEGLYQTERMTVDPADNTFLACALEGKADYLVSRDPHLRSVKYVHGIQIVGVKQFLSYVLTQKP